LVFLLLLVSFSRLWSLFSLFVQPFGLAISWCFLLFNAIFRHFLSRIKNVPNNWASRSSSIFHWGVIGDRDLWIGVNYQEANVWENFGGPPPDFLFPQKWTNFFSMGTICIFGITKNIGSFPPISISHQLISSKLKLH